MTKVDLIKALTEKTGSSKVQAEQFLEAFGEVITQVYTTGDSVNISAVGIFKTKNTKARVARNPRTGETVNVPAKKKLAFIPAKEYR
jgi:DNA-binding protein HU-beta